MLYLSLSPVQIRSIITNIIIMDGIVYFRYDTINDLFLITRDIIHGRSTAPRGARGLFSDHFAMLSWAWGPMCIFVHQSNSIIWFCFIFWGCLRFHLWNNNTDPTIAWLSQVDAYSCAVLYCDNSPYYFPCLSSRPRIPRCALLFLLLFCCFCNFNHDCSSIFYRLFLM